MSDWYLTNVIRDYDKRTGWNEQFSYSSVASVGNKLINFGLPTSYSVSLSSKTSPCTYSSMILSNRPGADSFNGSAAYIHEIINGKLITHKSHQQSSESYHDYIDSFTKYYRLFLPEDGRKKTNNLIINGGDHQDRTLSSSLPKYTVSSSSRDGVTISRKNHNSSPKAQLNESLQALKLPAEMSYKNSSLYYGKMYFPYSILEGTYIKNLSQNSRIQTNLWSNKQKFLFTSYYQFQNKNQCHELCYSNAESLVGYRSLYKFCIPSSPDMPFILHDDEIQLGSEWWVGFKNMVPSCSLSFKYKTLTGLNCDRPLYFSMSVNPLMGHIQSTFGLVEEIGRNDEKYDYRINDMVGVFSKYYFNLYSLKSNLSFGLSFQGYKIGLDLKTRNLRMMWNKKLNDNFILSTGLNLIMPYSTYSNGSLESLSEETVTINMPRSSPIRFGIELKYIGD